MASRQEEKEARRRERMEQEARERKAAARGKRLQYVVGGLLAAGIVAAVVVALVSSTGGGSGDGPSTASASAEIPEPAIFDEQEAAEAAGCEVTQVPNEGSTHENREFTAEDYESNPPTSGNHFPTAAAEGIYEEGAAPLGELVHSLEHGRINVQYKPGTDPQVIDQLETFAAEKQAYHLLMYENPTGMEPQIAATAWDWKLTCPEANPEVFDALRTFYDAHLDKGPEKVP